MPLLGSAPTSLGTYVAEGGLRGLERALASAPDAVIEELVRSGLRGRGGAGFPTGEKWRAIRGIGSGVRYAVCNAAEGEPATFKDRLLMRSNPYQVLEGLVIAAYAVGAERAYVGLKEIFATETESLTRALREMEAADALAGIPVEIVVGPDHYLLGEETGLLEVIEQRDPLPRILRPFMQGLYATAETNNPTLVNNVETLANVPHIVAAGQDWFRSSGTDTSPGTMLFTVAGDVRSEGVFELPLGTPLRSLIEGSAGGPRDGRSIKVVIPGASSTALIPEQLDTPLDFESMRAVGSGLGAGGFAVFDETACIVRVAALFSRFLYVESCGQCPPCKLGSGEITDLLDRFERGEGDIADLDTVLARAKTVTDGQKCALPTGESLLVQSLLQTFGEEFAAHMTMPCPSSRELVLPKIVDFDPSAGRFTYDDRYRLKQPDWTYAA
jgi:NADH:ubiquinone oxidoreductase subunit F (NADH-binding)